MNSSTDQQSISDARVSDIQKVFHSFMFDGEAPSMETENRATFVKSFLAEYYTTALQGASGNPENVHTHDCNITATCNTTSSDKKKDDKGFIAQHRTRSTEHASVFNSANSADEAERHNTMRDMANKLTEKLGGMCKLTGNNASNVVKGLFAQSTQAQEVGDLSNHLQLFVDNINESLQTLGTSALTEEELKLLLATAPLPSFTNDANTVSETNNDENQVRPRSKSVGEGVLKNVAPVNLVSRRLKHSVSDVKQQLQQLSFSLDSSSSDSVNKESTEEGEGEDSGNCEVGYEVSEEKLMRQRSCSLGTDFSTAGGGNGSFITQRRASDGEALESVNENETPQSTNPKRKLSRFFSRKMESISNLLENMEFAERDDSTNHKVFSKSKSFNFGVLEKQRGGATPPRSGYSTPRSGYNTPRDNDVDVVSLRLKLEVIEKAMCDEVAARTAAEQKVAELEEMVCRLKTDLERANSQKETVAAINKQMGVELRFLRQRNSRATADRQQWEDALVGETKKRRTLEEQMQMLIKSYKDSNEVATTALESEEKEGKGLTHKQQETVFSQQREEVLLAVIESLREQLAAADQEMGRARNDWQEESARYQETHDLLRFQIDQLTLTKHSTHSASADPDFEEKVDEVVHKNDRRSRQLSPTVSAFDLKHDVQADVVDSDKSAPASPSLPTPLSTPPTKSPSFKITPTKKKSSKSLLSTKAAERMKLFFLSTSWWPKFEFSSPSLSQPARPPVLLLQIAWWISELREYVSTNHISARFLAHSNQFCNCDECVNSVAKYAVGSL